MKLYTEEQLHNTVIAVSNYLDDINLGRAQENIKKYLKALEPIELPTDEEIEDTAEFFSDNSSIYDTAKDDILYGFREGAKWVINKIKGGDK